MESAEFLDMHLAMVNRPYALPRGSFRYFREGCPVVDLPALKPEPLSADEFIVNTTSMPSWAQPAFQGINQLNRIESKVYNSALFTNDNILLCAPNLAGQTNVAIMTILRQMSLHINRDDGSITSRGYMIVYVTPMKAHVSAIVDELSLRLKTYGVVVRHPTSDEFLTRQQCNKTQVLVTTPEKWDMMTRRCGDCTCNTLLDLLIIDNVHLLLDSRGPVLESIVARTLRQSEKEFRSIRLVGLSAPLPNYEDVALSLRVRLDGPGKGLFYFDNTYRPCPLYQLVIGITEQAPINMFRLTRDLCYKEAVSVAGKHQVLIFVRSSGCTTATANSLKQDALTNDTLDMFLNINSREILCNSTELVESNDLKDLLPFGFAIHHAGLASTDRQIVERLFSDGHVQVLVTTAFLAWGVSLRAQTVIIKDTQFCNPEMGGWTELRPLDVLQMLGHAGRPQYDTHGKAVIITNERSLHRYLLLITQQLPIESHLVSKLVDQLNTAIVFGTVQNYAEACRWLTYTYLFTRMSKAPRLYGLPPRALEQDDTLEGTRGELIQSALKTLKDINMVTEDLKSGCLQSTEFGRIASYYNISHGTIATYMMKLSRTVGDSNLYDLISLNEEFRNVTIEPDE